MSHEQMTGHGKCPDCTWFEQPEGCNVERDSSVCLINKQIRTPTEKQLLEAFSQIEKHDLKPNAIGCAVCGQWLNLETNEGELCSHLRHDFGLPEVKNVE